MSTNEISVQDFDESDPTTVSDTAEVDTRSMSNGSKTVHRQVVCLGDETTFGNIANVDGSGRLSVSIDNVASAIAVTDNSSTLSVDDGAGSLTVDNAALSVTGGGVEASAVRVTLANDSTGVLSVDDNGSTISIDDGAGNISIDDGGNTITVDGTVAVTGVSTEAKQDTQITALQLIDDIVKTDDAAFTPGTDKVAMVGAEFDDTTPDSVNEGDAGALRMSANRNLYTTIRDAAGNERGVNVTAGNALTVDASATTQPISAASLPLPSGAATAANQSTANTALAAIETAVELIDNTVSGTELQVDVVAALPAGTNNIGDVDVATIAAGDNNIGNVDIASAIPAGTNNIGDVDVASTPKSSTATAHAQTSVGTSVVTLLSANANRKRFMVQNTGTTIIKLGFGTTDPTSTSYHVALQSCVSADDGTGGFYIDEMWTGAVEALGSAAGGAVVVTELT